MRSRPPIVAALAAALAALAIAAAPAAAATITVETAADVSATECTLRNAIIAANTDAPVEGCKAGSGADTIDFDVPPNSTITFTVQPDTLNTNTAVVGPGAGQLTISGGDTHRVFEISGATVSISGLTIAHGGACTEGCGLRNGGTVTLEGVVVSHNAARDIGGTDAFAEGGGIQNLGTMTIVDSTIVENEAAATGASNQNGASGGGIYNTGGGELTIVRSTIAGNTASADASGGASTNAIGGGITNAGTLVVEDSTISGNTASGKGGVTSNDAQGAGIFDSAASSVKVTIDRSTIAGNTASATGTSPSSKGGGLTVEATTTSYAVRSSTIVGNSAATGANAVLIPVATLVNTIVAQPLGGGADCSGNATSLGYNLADTTGCGLTQATDQTGVDPKLSPAGLADNGGPTKTIALLEGSPAIDKGLSSAGETTDQRGLTRPVEIPGVANAEGGDGTDIGAFEVQLPAAGSGGSTQAPGASTGPIPSATPRPKVTIKALPATTHKRSLKVRLISSAPGARFRCRLDRKPYRACRSPLILKGLTVGRHTLSVTATAGGVTGDAVTRKFRVLAPRQR